MKKLMKSLLLMIMAMALLVLSGCGDEKVEEEPASLLGAWTLTDMTGTDEAEQAMQEYKSLGWKVTMAISNDQIEMVTFDGEHTEYEVVDYRIEGTQIVTDASRLDYVLEGKTLKLTTDGVTMVYTQK